MRKGMIVSCAVVCVMEHTDDVFVKCRLVGMDLCVWDSLVLLRPHAVDALGDRWNGATDVLAKGCERGVLRVESDRQCVWNVSEELVDRRQRWKRVPDTLALCCRRLRFATSSRHKCSSRTRCLSTGCQFSFSNPRQD